MSTKKVNGSLGRCPSCGRHPLEARCIRDEFDYGPPDERVRVVAEAVPVLVCPACDEVFYGPEAEQVHHRAICKALGLLTPEQIRAVRERLGLNQEEFAGLTGIGKATLSRWETGRLMQSRSLDGYLQVLGGVPEAVRFLKRLRDSRAPEPSPWRFLKVTAGIRLRESRFQLHANGAAARRSQEEDGRPASPALEELAKS